MAQHVQNKQTKNDNQNQHQTPNDDDKEEQEKNENRDGEGAFTTGNMMNSNGNNTPSRYQISPQDGNQYPNRQILSWIDNRNHNNENRCINSDSNGDEKWHDSFTIDFGELFTYWNDKSTTSIFVNAKFTELKEEGMNPKNDAKLDEG